DLARQAQFFLADAVDAVANDDFFLPRLDVDVGRAQVVGVLDDAVGQLDDRAGVFADIARAVLPAALDRFGELGAELVHHVVEPGGANLFAGEFFANVLFATEQAHHAQSGHLVDFYRDRQIEGVGEGHQ